MHEPTRTTSDPERCIIELMKSAVPVQPPRRVAARPADLAELLHASRVLAGCIGGSGAEPDEITGLAVALRELLALAAQREQERAGRRRY